MLAKLDSGRKIEREKTIKINLDINIDITNANNSTSGNLETHDKKYQDHNNSLM